MRITLISSVLTLLGCVIFLPRGAELQTCEDQSFCGDLESFCSESTVEHYCPKLCGKCTESPSSAPPQDPPCSDDESQCPDWESYCETNSWMETNCKKTCGLCGARGWSECTKTCGGGTRYREKCDGDECETVYEACSTAECPKKTCYFPQKERYGIHHSCCMDEVFPKGSECGQPFVNSKVIGGENAKLKRWPWMVAIITTRGDFCAGVLISNKFVLSAAHCFIDGLGREYNTAGWKLRVGVLRLSDRGVDLNMKKITVHPNYTFPENDIVVIKLTKKVKFSSTIQPICLPGGEVTPQDTTCYVSGWGISELSPDTTTDHLQEAAIQNLDRKICQKAFAANEQMEHVMNFLNGDGGYLCAGSLHKKVDSCGGDSGGPLVCQRCSSCTWYLAGLVSFGLPDCGTMGVPGAYTRILDYEEWIAKITGVRQQSRTCS